VLGLVSNRSAEIIQVRNEDGAGSPHGDHEVSEVDGPLVTVITPTYNHGEYIGPCIESVLSQTYPKWEQIVVDDGSTDKTPEIIGGYNDARIRYLRQENLGIFRLPETYNRALAAARGELIAILEGDDFWPPDKLETLVPAFEDGQVVLAYGLACPTSPTGKELKWTIPPDWYQRQYTRAGLFNEPVGSATRLMLRADGGLFTFPCSVLIRSSALQAMGGFQGSPDFPGTDYPTFLELTLRGRFFFVPKVMGYWRQHLQSVTWARDDWAVERERHRLALAFLERHKDELGLKQHETAIVAESFEHMRAEQWFLRGRQLLLLGQWAQARRTFTEGLAAKTFRSRLKAFLGYWASWLHRDLEGLIGLFGKGDEFRERYGLNER
jgi:glycosyltransferase involved in cell wall biosynthesis